MRALQGSFIFGVRNTFAVPLQSQHETKNARCLGNAKAECVRRNPQDSWPRITVGQAPTLSLLPTFLLSQKCPKHIRQCWKSRPGFPEA